MELVTGEIVIVELVTGATVIGEISSHDDVQVTLENPAELIPIEASPANPKGGGMQMMPYKISIVGGLSNVSLTRALCISIMTPNEVRAQDMLKKSYKGFLDSSRQEKGLDLSKK